MSRPRAELRILRTMADIETGCDKNVRLTVPSRVNLVFIISFEIDGPIDSQIRSPMDIVEHSSMMQSHPFRAPHGEEATFTFRRSGSRSRQH